MKLSLDENQELPSWVSASDVKDQLKRKGKDAQTVVADYLAEVWKHGKAALEKRYGKTFLATTRLDFVLTVPAVWSDAAKDATLRAAQKAGIGPNLSLISEPEAAAVYTLKTLLPKDLRVGNNFIVCDAGGGTVDLISCKCAHPTVSTPLPIVASGRIASTSRSSPNPFTNVSRRRDQASGTASD